ncbi:MAG: type II/IV secretion system protein [Candidatus Riflebacteria bacterium]|nr:type II/IV secretion system protein [Candidatus Riflebacteria bacterium]
MIHKRLGDILVDSGLIDSQQLETAIAKQKETGKRLGSVLVELGFAADTDIVTCLASQLEICSIPDEMLEVPQEIRQLIPEDIIRRHTLLPVKLDGKTLTLAMADPFDTFIVEEIRFQTNLDVQEAIATESGIQTAIKTTYGDREKENKDVEPGLAADDQMAKSLASQLGIPHIPDEMLIVPPDIRNLIPEVIIRRHTLLPVKLIGKTLTVAMVDPLDAFIVDEIRLQTNLEVQEAVATANGIRAAIRATYGGEDEEAEAEKMDEAVKILAAEQVAPVATSAMLGGGMVSFDLQATDVAATVNFVSRLIKQAITDNASDIHLEPAETNLRIRIRVDGVLNEILRIPKASQGEIISRLKVMADMDIAEKRLPQDGRIRVKVIGKDVDLRVSSLPTVWGEKICMRILDKSALTLSLKDVGFDDDLLARFEIAIKQPNGIILLNGPTGSGKTSTLYAAINYISSPKINVNTVEDPVEMQIKDINQVQVKSDIGLTFATTLRALMRQDPNVIMIGEIRDGETAQIAVEAAMTGHLVLSTLHTNDASSTVGRLIDLQVEPYLLASTLLAAVAQRLTRKICSKCVTPYEPTESQLKDLQMEQYGITGKIPFFKGAGCPLCKTTGYKGRTGIHEMMTLDDELRRLIVAKASASELRARAFVIGMRPLRQTGISKASRGITTIEEVLRVTKSEVV